MTDATAALLFPTGVLGYISATFVVPSILRHCGWRGVALLAAAVNLVSAILLITGPPFTIVLLSYYVGGIGVGIGDAGFCAWASKMLRANVVQGLMHGSFSVGCILGPVLTMLVYNQGFEWYGFYCLLVGKSRFSL